MSDKPTLLQVAMQDKGHSPSGYIHLQEDPKPTPCGGSKDSTGKAPWGLLPPEPIDALLQVLEAGARKYGERNWEKGISWIEIWQALMRHLWAWRKGEDLDPESGLPHLHHALANLAFLVAYRARKIGADDRVTQ